MNRKEITGILGAIIFTILSIGLFWVLKNIIHIEEGLSYVTVLLLPILIYAIISGKITEFQAGGISAKFSQMANQKVDLSADTIEPSSEELGVITKGGRSHLEDSMKTFPKDKKAILTLSIGKSYYSRSALLHYGIELDRRHKNIKHAVVTNEKGKYLSCISLVKMQRLLEDENMGEVFVNALNNNESSIIEELPGFSTASILENSKNIDALELMDELDETQLIIVDKEKCIKGIVEREDILTKLVLAIARG